MNLKHAERMTLRVCVFVCELPLRKCSLCTVQSDLSSSQVGCTTGNNKRSHNVVVCATYTERLHSSDKQQVVNEGAVDGGQWHWRLHAGDQTRQDLLCHFKLCRSSCGKKRKTNTACA